ncbi:MAG: Rnf-Nqr domain containing protein [Gammaproteobacteria bacterium]
MSGSLAALLATICAGNLVVDHLLGISAVRSAARNTDAADALALGGAAAILVTALGGAAAQWLLDLVGAAALVLPATMLMALAAARAVCALAARLAPAHEPFAALELLLAFDTAVLGAALLVQHEAGDWSDAAATAIGLAIGFALVTLALAALSQRLRAAPVPAAFAGLPIVLLTLALAALAGTGFHGLGTR